MAETLDDANDVKFVNEDLARLDVLYDVITGHKGFLLGSSSADYGNDIFHLIDSESAE